MSRIIHGTLFVPSYQPTGNPGEWTITNAIYTNVSDDTGIGAYAIQTGFILYVPAANINTQLPVPGVVHRYKITSHTVINASTINATILWDEGGSEVDRPHNGDYAMISEVGTGIGLAFPVSNQIYPLMKPGMDIAAIAVEEKVKIDKIQTSGGGALYSYKVYTLKTDTFTLTSADISNRYVTLRFPPYQPAETTSVYYQGSRKFYATDYIITLDGTIERRLSWNGLGLQSSLTAGQKLVINYMSEKTLPGPNLSTSAIFLSDAFVVSGSNITVLLQAKDASGNNITTGGDSVTFFIDGTASGNFSSVIDNYDGTYTSTFTGIVSGMGQISATIDGQLLTSSKLIEVVPGSISIAKSYLSIDSPTQTASLTPFEVIFQAVDANNNIIEIGGAAVTCEYSINGGSYTPGSVIDNENGTYTFPIVGTQAGNYQVRGIYNGLKTAPFLVTVVAAEPSITTSYITIAPNSMTGLLEVYPNIMGGNQTTVRLHYFDEFNNPLPKSRASSYSTAFEIVAGTSQGIFQTSSVQEDYISLVVGAGFTPTIEGTPIEISARINGGPLVTNTETLKVLTLVTSAGTYAPNILPKNPFQLINYEYANAFTAQANQISRAEVLIKSDNPGEVLTVKIYSNQTLPGFDSQVFVVGINKATVEGLPPYSFINSYGLRFRNIDTQTIYEHYIDTGYSDYSSFLQYAMNTGDFPTATVSLLETSPELQFQFPDIVAGYVITLNENTGYNYSLELFMDPNYPVQQDVGGNYITVSVKSEIQQLYKPVRNLPGLLLGSTSVNLPTTAGDFMTINFPLPTALPVSAGNLYWAVFDATGWGSYPYLEIRPNESSVDFNNKYYVSGNWITNLKKFNFRLLANYNT